MCKEGVVGKLVEMEKVQQIQFLSCHLSQRLSICLTATSDWGQMRSSVVLCAGRDASGLCIALLSLYLRVAHQTETAPAMQEPGLW